MWWMTLALAGDPVKEAQPQALERRSAVLQREKMPVLEAGNKKASVRPLVTGLNAFLGDLWLEPGVTVPEHRDATEEYLVFFEGGGSITIDGEVSEVTAGSVVFMPARAQVAYVNGPARTHVLQVFAGPAPAEKYNSWSVKP